MEIEAEATAAGGYWKILQVNLVDLAQFPGDVETQASALGPGGKEGFKNLTHLTGIDAGALIQHFHEWMGSGLGKTHIQLNAGGSLLGRPMHQGVVAQVG